MGWVWILSFLFFFLVKAWSKIAPLAFNFFIEGKVQVAHGHKNPHGALELLGPDS